MLNYLPLDILKYSPISLDIMGSDIIQTDILGLIGVWDPQQVTPSFWILVTWSVGAFP